MKKILGLMLGMSLVLGSVSFAFGQDTTDTSKKSSKKKSKKKKGSTSSTTM